MINPSFCYQLYIKAHVRPACGLPEERYLGSRDLFLLVEPGSFEFISICFSFFAPGRICYALAITVAIAIAIAIDTLPL